MNGGLSIYSIKYKILKKSTLDQTKNQTSTNQTVDDVSWRGAPMYFKRTQEQTLQEMELVCKTKRGFLGMNKGNKNDKEKNRKRQLNLVQAMNNYETEKL